MLIDLLINSVQGDRAKKMGESKEKVVALAIIFMILPLITVTLRIWSKIERKSSLTADDHMILLALVNMQTLELILEIDPYEGIHPWSWGMSISRSVALRLTLLGTMV